MKGRRVFISYAHNDYSLIQSISARLKDSNDLLWIDRTFIIAGDDWRSKIQKALKSSYCVIFFASNSSIRSKEVKLEIDYAIKLRKRVIPVLLEDCDLPYEVSNLHYVTLTYRTPEEIEVLRQILSAISSKRITKSAINETATTIVQDIKTANNFYNTVILHNRFLWTSTLAGLAFFFFITFFLERNNSSSSESRAPDTTTTAPDTTATLPKDTAMIRSDTAINH